MRMHAYELQAQGMSFSGKFFYCPESGTGFGIVSNGETKKIQVVVNKEWKEALHQACAAKSSFESERIKVHVVRAIIYSKFLHVMKLANDYHQLENWISKSVSELPTAMETEL